MGSSSFVLGSSILVSVRVDKEVIREVFTKEVLKDIFPEEVLKAMFAKEDSQDSSVSKGDKTACTESLIVHCVVDWAFTYLYSFNSFRTKHNEKDPVIKENVTKIKFMSSKDNISFRYSKNAMLRLQEHFQAINRTETIKECLAAFFKYKGITQKELFHREYLVSRAGVKRGIVLNLAKNAIEDIMHNNEVSVYAEPFMGTANVFAHLPQPEANCVRKYLNDAECDIVNFFNTLQKYPDEFIKALPVDVNKEIFEDMKNIRKGIELPTRNKKDQIASAVAFYYTLLLSYYGDMQSFRKEATSKTLDNKINTIRKVAELLEDVSISKNDWEYFLKKIMNVPKNEKEKVLIYADPPYIFTEKVYDASKKGFNHKKFGKQLISYGEEGATFLLSYRATARKKSEYTNADVQEVLDSIYMGDKSYIAFTWASKRKNETQVEVLISNYNFEGSVPYNDEIAILMKQQGFA